MQGGARTPNKGSDRRLQAFAGLLEGRPAGRLVLKGTDSLFRSEEMLKGQLAELPRDAAARVAARITYLGGNYSFADMARLYQAADAYVAPYLAEGFNLPALEAAAFGLRWEERPCGEEWFRSV